MTKRIKETSKQKYWQLIENSLQGIVIIQDFKVVYANPAFSRVTGYPIKELLSFTPEQVMELAHPDDRDKLWGNFRKRMAGIDISPHYQFKGLSKEGKTKILELYANKIEYEGKPAIQGFILDITNQVVAQEAIEQRTKLIETILNNIPMGIVVNEIESGNSNLMNKEFQEIFGWSENEIPNVKKFLNKVFPDPEIRKSLSSRFKTDIREKKPENMFWDSVEIKSKSGEEKFLSVRNIPLYDQKLMILTVQDITERIKTETQLHNSLREKEILLREIHHRVKNNLQTITSLLDLQAESLKDAESRKAFKSSQSRIRSMALIHERLYKSENLESIKAREYVQHLIEYLEGTYQTSDSNIEIKTDVANLFLNLDTAIPCGLIINELASNAMKYAFKKNKRGKVLVSLQKQAENKLILQVTDNGMGIPSEVTLENSSTLGLQLVSLLSKQINGNLKIDRTNGTNISISFPLQFGIEEIEQK
jgi:PAS domain S-box-containing protein